MQDFRHFFGLISTVIYGLLLNRRLQLFLAGCQRLYSDFSEFFGFANSKPKQYFYDSEVNKRKKIYDEQKAEQIDGDFADFVLYIWRYSRVLNEENHDILHANQAKFVKVLESVVIVPFMRICVPHVPKVDAL